MTPWQVQVLEKWEPELRPNLSPLDRNVVLDSAVLAEHIRLMQDFFYFSPWPKEKLVAAAIVYLLVFGYDPAEKVAAG